MNRTQRFAAVLSLLVTACATPSSAPPAQVASLDAHFAVTLPASAGEGRSKEVIVHLDEGPLKLATIALRDGTELPPHTAPVPVTIHVLEGDGVIHVGQDPLIVTSGSVILLPAHAEHDVIPRAGTDMLLLVHYMRGATGS
jgi:quercetin dioxygenase-like cupin family protein